MSYYVHPVYEVEILASTATLYIASTTGLPLLFSSIQELETYLFLFTGQDQRSSQMGTVDHE